MPTYDLAIIGSGPGGYVTAIRAAQWGLKTLVIEKDGFLGGTCLHVGCIPTKVLLHHAEIYETFKNAKEFGIEVSDVKLNWPAMLARKERIVNKHAKGIEFLFRKNKVEIHAGLGTLGGAADTSRWKTTGKITDVEATHIMFATGSEARSLPGVEFDGKVIVGNRDILKLPQVPKKLVIVGAGAVGVEFASIFRSFGTEVTILEMLPRVVPLEDEEISAELEKAFRKRGIQIFTEAKVESVKKDAAGAPRSRFAISRAPRKTSPPSVVLMAVGRSPLTQNVGLEKTRAKTRARLRARRTVTWKPPSRRSTPSATSWPECRNWRTPRPWKASSPSARSPASRCRRSNAAAFPTPPTASRRSARSA